ncbi:nucleoside-diphosphate-sugar epimerase domain protein [Vibrio parahaemolyticus AQ3810]|nr:nucleoside-diphosphate-sugar epimerase domain protein [Vibrio parahaemolyticus AQ3810]
MMTPARNSVTGTPDCRMIFPVALRAAKWREFPVCGCMALK